MKIRRPLTVTQHLHDSLFQGISLQITPEEKPLAELAELISRNWQVNERRPLLFVSSSNSARQGFEERISVYGVNIPADVYGPLNQTLNLGVDAQR
jgi:hypothetical protein